MRSQVGEEPEYKLSIAGTVILCGVLAAILVGVIWLIYFLGRRVGPLPVSIVLAALLLALPLWRIGNALSRAVYHNSDETDEDENEEEEEQDEDDEDSGVTGRPWRPGRPRGVLPKLIRPPSCGTPASPGRR